MTLAGVRPGIAGFGTLEDVRFVRPRRGRAPGVDAAGEHVQRFLWEAPGGTARPGVRKGSRCVLAPSGFFVLFCFTCGEIHTEFTFQPF